MTEAEWLTSTDPAAMLDWRQGSNPLRDPCPLPPLSDRKLRLFACACGWLLAKDPKNFYGLTMAEKGAFITAVEDYADGGPRPERPDGSGACYLPGRSGAGAARHCVDLRESGGEFSSLLRCICGNPWRPVVVRGLGRCPNCHYYDPYEPQKVCGCENHWERGPGADWLIWNDGTVRKLAEAIYAERDFTPDRLGVLADALEDAGCVETSEETILHRYICERCDKVSDCSAHKGHYCHHCGSDYVRKQRLRDLPHPIVTHLRAPGPHCRGCWAVDLLTGRP